MTRVCFVGQREYFEACALSAPAGGLEPVFVDHRGGVDPSTMLARVRAAAPGVVVVFRPEIVPPGAFEELDAVTLGFTTEPLPRGPRVHPDQDFGLRELHQADPAQFDRIVSFDPLSAAASPVPVWRSVPLPVDDRFYRPVRAAGHPPRVVFIGFSTPHRERWLIDAKHHFDVVHIAWGLHGDALREQFARTDVAINLHLGPFPSFENRVCLHLAAGHLVLTEPLSPRHGLVPGADYVEMTRPDQLVALIGRVRAVPDAFDAVRREGRRSAERFRASRVWPRVVGDLLADVAAFGSVRRRSEPLAAR